MPQSYFKEFEDFAPAKLDCQTPQRWFNTYGTYIIETVWNPQKRAYDSIYHKYNKPDLSLMPNE